MGHAAAAHIVDLEIGPVSGARGWSVLSRVLLIRRLSLGSDFNDLVEESQPGRRVAGREAAIRRADGLADLLVVQIATGNDARVQLGLGGIVDGAALRRVPRECNVTLSIQSCGRFGLSKTTLFRHQSPKLVTR